MFPDIYPHASVSITPYDGFFIENFLFFSNKNEYQKSDFHRFVIRFPVSDFHIFRHHAHACCT